MVKKIFNVLGKIFNWYIHIWMLYNILMLVVICYGIITDKPNALDNDVAYYTANVTICCIYIQNKKIEELKNSINNDKN